VTQPRLVWAVRGRDKIIILDAAIPMSFAKPPRERNTIANQSEDNSLLFNVQATTVDRCEFIQTSFSKS
jgi:hypothetical protein